VTSVETFLVIVAAILILGSFGEWLFALTSVPDALWLLAAGIAIGPILGIAQQDQLTTVAPYLGALTIIVILFDGGSRLDIATTVRTAPRATLLAFLGFLIAILIVCLASMAAAAAGVIPQPWSWQHGLLLGAILGGSSSVVVMPAVIRAGVGPRVSGLVSLESALTDVLCIVGASTIVELMAIGGAGAAPDPVGAVVRTFGLGIVGGLVGGGLGLVALRWLRGSEYAYPLLLGGLLILYVAVDAGGGSAPLAVLICALIVANAHLPGFSEAEQWPGSLGPTVRGLHGMIAFLIKAFFFVFMGAMVGPLSVEMAFGVLLAGLLLIGRVVAVRLATRVGPAPAGPRGRSARRAPAVCRRPWVRTDPKRHVCRGHRDNRDLRRRVSIGASQSDGRDRWRWSPGSGGLKTRSVASDSKLGTTSQPPARPA
jgi:potassium/hydrogen antiporter